MSSLAANQTNSNLDVNSSTNPSIFEILAQKSLSTSLRRAANHLKNILYSNDTQRFYFLNKYFEEIYFLIDICIQLSHLRSFSASFCEHFYSLKRVSGETNSRLNRKQFYFSIISLTVLPYLKSKIDAFHEDFKLKSVVNHSGSDPKLKLFFQNYPMIRAIFHLVVLYYQMSYSVGQNIYCSPILRLLRIRLINCDSNDIIENRRLFESIDQNIDWFSYLSQYSMKITKLLAKSFSIGLSVTAFFIQFLDFWYSSGNLNTSFAVLPIPPSPKNNEIEISRELCPICLRIRENDTALMTSGFVFCYSCITNHLKTQNRCPVTGYPSTSHHLIKIYPPNG